MHYFLTRGAAAQAQLFYLNHRQPVDLMDQVSPFDLVVVTRNARERNHFTMSVTGVTEFCDDQQGEFVPMGEWMRLIQAVELTRELHFFKCFRCAPLGNCRSTQLGC